MTFRSGFVNIVGRPNVGKSTLMNALVGENMSIITYKPQTTRHRILGIINGTDFQMILSDTPGFVHDPSYKMHEKMNRYVYTTFEDADIMILVTDQHDNYTKDHVLIEKLNAVECPVFLAINKVDQMSDQEVLELIASWKDMLNFRECLPISALKKIQTDKLRDLVIYQLPEGPVYFPDDQLSDRTERFFVSEIIREQIFLHYKQEIPYSCEVAIESFKEEDALIRIEALIFVNRKTQKSILIGKGGSAIKKLGIESRKRIEEFLDKKVFLQLLVKVRENWRDDDLLLKRMGYDR